jgi:hypothetical protein
MAMMVESADPGRVLLANGAKRPTIFKLGHLLITVTEAMALQTDAPFAVAWYVQ